MAQHRFGTGAEAPNLWLVVFDLDGTLIDFSEDLCGSVNAAMRHVGRKALSKEQITRFVGDGAAALVQRALGASHHDPSGSCERAEFNKAFRFFLEFYRDHKLDTTSAYPGVLETLRSIRQARPELLMAVLTNKPIRPSREICDALGLTPFFFANYGGDSFSTKKPHPEGLLQIMDQARACFRQRGGNSGQLRSDGVVMVGDAPPDMLVARACGARSLGCLYGLDPAALRSAAPDRTVESPTEWLQALGL